MPARYNLNRRIFLATLASCTIGNPAHTAVPQRVVALDWALLENLLALKYVPVAAAELVLFRKLAVEPPVPDEVVDLGLRSSVNMELLAALSPDLIYVSQFSSQSPNLLSQIAQTRSFNLFEAGIRPIPNLESAMFTMGAELGRSDESAAYIAETRSKITNLRNRLDPIRSRPVYLVDMANARTVRAYREDSLFGNALELLGFENAFGMDSAFPAYAPIGIEAMAQQPDALIVIVGPLPPEVGSGFAHSKLWNAIPAVKAGRVLQLPAANAFGSLPAIRRFTSLLGNAAQDLLP